MFRSQKCIIVSILCKPLENGDRRGGSDDELRCQYTQQASGSRSLTSLLLSGLNVAQEKGQLLENVFADPKGFGIAPDGRYRYELPGFSSGTAAVS